MILRSFESASKGMLGLVDLLDSTANNLANVNTVGFKKEQLTFKNVYDATVAQNEGTLLNGTSRNLGNLSMGSQVQKLTYDFSQGALQRTGNSLDVAIEGDGFLKVQSADGDMAYTRNGSLTLDNNSFLMTKEGDYVLDPEDRRIQINMRDVIFDDLNKITIGEKGHIEVNQGMQKIQLQQIAVYDFQNKESMFRMGNSKFVSRDNVNNPPVIAEKYTIQQGMLEMSNSNVIKEMISTINTSRNYESLQKHVKTSGQMLSQAISVGRIKS